MRSDHLTRLEKAALTTSMAGAVFNVFVWYIGAQQPATDWQALYILRVVAGAITAVSFDMVCVVTTMGRRDGRRSAWSWLTALAAAAASAAIALDVAWLPRGEPDHRLSVYAAPGSAPCAAARGPLALPRQARAAALATAQ